MYDKLNLNIDVLFGNVFIYWILWTKKRVIFGLGNSLSPDYQQPIA